MIFGDGIFFYFYYKRQAEIEEQRQKELDDANPWLRHMRRNGKLIHLGITEEEIDERMLRTDQNTICPICGKTHIEHPLIDDVLDFDGQPFLHSICDGTLAKL